MDELRTIDHPPTTGIPARSVPARSRRSVLAAGAAAAGALVSRSLADPDPVSAAGVVLGGVNTANAATTIRTTQASASAKALVGQVMTAIVGPDSAGVQGTSNANGGMGVFGLAPNGASRGVFGRSTAGTGVHGESTATTGVNRGVRGVSPSTSGVGVQGIASATSGGTIGVLGNAASPAGWGVQGKNSGTNGTGVYGVADTGGSAKGMWGHSTEGSGIYGDGWVGVQGHSDQGYGVFAQGGSAGVRGEASTVGGVGVYGIAPNGVAINFGTRGSANSSAGRGVQGDNGGLDGTGVVGFAPNGAGARGVIARADQGVGLEAKGGSHGVLASGTTGVQGESDAGNGVYGRSTAEGTSGVYGESLPAAAILGYGVAGRARFYALWGEASYAGSSPGNGGRAVTGLASGANGMGVYGLANASGAVAVYGQAAPPGAPLAGYFQGDVTITGTLTAPASLLQVDHPDSPAERWYRRAPVGSFEQVTVIGGNVVTGPSGQRAVKVAPMFARYHTDVRYQLTQVGHAGAAWVADELDARGRFTIATDKPNVPVSWQLTGVRTDPAAAKAPLRVEGPKPKRYRGRFLQPELFGQPRRQALIDPERPVTGPTPPKPPKRSGASRARD